MTLALDRFTRPAAVHHRQIGDYRLTSLPDGAAYLEPRTWYPASNDEMWSEHAHLVNRDGWLVASIGALLIEHDNQCVLIDAGPGHSLGHLAYTLTSGTRRLVCFGDALQSPVQIRHPDLTSAIDDDPTTARTTARALVDDLTLPGTDGFGLHFADAQFGHVTTAPDGTRTWQPTT